MQPGSRACPAPRPGRRAPRPCRHGEPGGHGVAPAPAEEVGARPGLRALARLLPHQHLQAGEWPPAPPSRVCSGRLRQQLPWLAGFPRGGGVATAAALPLCPDRWALLSGDCGRAEVALFAGAWARGRAEAGGRAGTRTQCRGPLPRGGYYPHCASVLSTGQVPCGVGVSTSHFSLAAFLEGGVPVRQPGKRDARGGDGWVAKPPSSEASSGLRVVQGRSGPPETQRDPRGALSVRKLGCVEFSFHVLTPLVFLREKKTEWFGGKRYPQAVVSPA